MKFEIKKYARVLGLLFITVCLAPAGLFAAAPAYQFLSVIAVDRPTALAVDSLEKVYVAEATKNHVLICDSKGSRLGKLSGLAKPISVAVDAAGRIFVGNDHRHNVEAYSPGGELLFKLGAGDGEFQKPNDIEIDSLGNIYVVDSAADLVKVYNQDGSHNFSFGGTGNTNGLFNFPTAIAVNEINQEIIVTDYQITSAGVTMGMPGTSFAYLNKSAGKGARAQVFDMAGVHKLSFSKFGYDDGLLNKPLGVAVDPLGNIYIADASQNVVQVFSSTGVSLGTIFSPANPLRTPTDIVISPITERIYIPSLNAGTVAVFGLTGTYTVTASAGPGGAISPAGSFQAEHGDIIEFTVSPDAGYKTTQVLVDGIAQENLTSVGLVVKADRTVEAVFEPNTFTVTATAGANGEVSPASPVQIIAGDSLTIDITPAANYHLDSLVVDGTPLANVNGMTSYTFTDIQAPHGLAAGFAVDTFTISAVSGANGQVTIPGSGVVAYGGSLTVTILPWDGYRLVDVLVDGAPVGPTFSYTFDNIDADHTVVPVFEEILYTVTAAVTEGGEVTPAGVTAVEQGAGQDYSIVPAAGYLVSEVLVDGNPVGPVDSYNFSNIDADHTISAVFVPDSTSERFETGNLRKLPWRTGGGSGWVVQNEVTFNGNYSAESPNVDTSFLEVPLTITEAGDIGFWFSLSGRRNKLRFLVDGMEQGSWSGDRGWTEVQFVVSLGTHVFRWEYEGGSGYDAAWLDDISLPTYAAPLFPMFDLKADNGDDPVSLDKRDDLVLSVAVLYGDWQPPRGSEWVITQVNAKSANNPDKKSGKSNGKDQGKAGDSEDRNRGDDDSDSDDGGIAGKKLVRFKEPVADGPVHSIAARLDKFSKGDYILVFGVYAKDGGQPLYSDSVEVHVE